MKRQRNIVIVILLEVKETAITVHSSYKNQRNHQKDKLVFAANINRTSMKEDSLVYTFYLFFIYCFIYISPLYFKLFLFNPFPFTSHCLEQYTLYQGLKYWMPTFLHSDYIIDLTYQHGACYTLFNSASGRRMVWMDGSTRPGHNSCSVFTSWYQLHSRHVNCSDVARLKSKHKGAACKKSKIGRKR
ncbi:hypothetical protein Peur_034851 [Populus x canadensis]